MTMDILSGNNLIRLFNYSNPIVLRTITTLSWSCLRNCKGQWRYTDISKRDNIIQCCQMREIKLDSCSGKDVCLCDQPLWQHNTGLTVLDALLCRFRRQGMREWQSQIVKHTIDDGKKWQKHDFQADSGFRLELSECLLTPPVHAVLILVRQDVSCSNLTRCRKPSFGRMTCDIWNLEHFERVYLALLET